MVYINSKGFRMSLSPESRIQNISKLGLNAFLTTDIKTMNDLYEESFQGSILFNVFPNGNVQTRKDLIDLSTYMDKLIFFRNFKFKDVASVGCSVYLTIQWEIMDQQRNWILCDSYVCIKLARNSSIQKMNIYLNEMKTYKPKSKLKWNPSFPRLFRTKFMKNIPKESEDDMDISRHPSHQMNETNE